MAEEIKYHFSQRSEMAQEIISRKPGFLEKSALYLFLGILVILISSTWFVKYPDIIEGKALLSATNAPKELIIRHEGRLTKLLAGNRKQVVKNELLGLMESTASHQDVLRLSSMIDKCIVLLNANRFKEAAGCFSGGYGNLGEARDAYREFIGALQQFDDYMVNGFYGRKMEMLRQDIETLEQAKEVIQRQFELTEQDMLLAEESFNMNRNLFEEKVIAREAFRNEKSKFVNKKMTVSQLSSAILSNITQKREKLKEIDQLKHDLAQQKALFLQAVQSLQNVVDEWKRKYVIVAPIDGEVVLNVPLQEQQFLQQGKMIGYIDPGHSHYFAEVNLPQANFGKVDTGQQVQLRVAAYPFQEVGFLQGTINYVSRVSTDSGFVATVRLDNGLVTSNNVPLAYKSGLKAEAIVITRNVRLMNRLVNNVFKSVSVGTK
ncbi:HlyD family efflux transporter periplasmic adaptor subunit [Chitinophaga lutea]|uniref:HlyD family efflux transporter periplasmic adaptor subunit n=1 Tax=Chitinophaga lutea TaxID=2488634 RepID=A0A3N4QKG6_9BACT|nr:HlyD family secretion protein [Chitinophaga lutea]RPE12264.1 HlyD family efflux transporter periplasmic adaptor subunit [Chitinophaga lutea]